MTEGDERTADECDGVHVKDYCKECGCPKEICCRKEGAIEAYNKIWQLCLKSNTHTDNISRIMHFIENEEKRLKELKGVN